MHIVDDQDDLMEPTSSSALPAERFKPVDSVVANSLPQPLELGTPGLRFFLFLPLKEKPQGRECSPSVEHGEGEAYSQWSNVMKYFILAQDFELWDIIEEGYIEAPKKKKKQRSENDTKAKLNARAMHILLCGLNEEVSKKVSTCKRAKEMWEKLERLYGKEEKKDGVLSCANLLQSSKVDGVVALNEPEVSSNSCDSNSYSFEEL
ncbi:hypothetical protein V6N12_059156 [Hibiscus sabdariffa]|uniref:DUF4219 domain-containing protein n=1 Tax=Hibiscus sabdariffa TaxID=183260 RepID=A0ABR2EU87_9ROSI